MTTTISASVGRGGRNMPTDVGIVQTLLNRHLPGLGLPGLEVNSTAGPETIAAIESFQQRVVKLSTPDGRVDPGGRTFVALAGPISTPSETSVKLSGSTWWHANQARFPNSDSISDLAAPFRGNVEAFVSALKAAGASIEKGPDCR